MSARIGALVLGLGLALLAGCGPRNKVGDRLLGQSSLTNARSGLNPQAQPAQSP